MSVFFDRDAVREVLWPLWDSAQMDDGEINAMLAGVEACVRQQTIDRDALEQLVRDLYAPDTFEDNGDALQSWVDGFLALLRPADGVTLTHEDAQVVLSWFEQAEDAVGMDEVDLAAMWRIRHQVEL